MQVQSPCSPLIVDIYLTSTFLEDFCSASDLSLNTHLRSLSIDKFIFFSDYTFSSIFPWILEILSRLRSNGMKEICFHLYLGSMDDLYGVLDEPVPWEDFDRILSRAPLFSVPLLFFLVHGRHSDVVHDEVKREIIQLLPACHRQGRVHVRRP